MKLSAIRLDLTVWGQPAAGVLKSIIGCGDPDVVVGPWGVDFSYPAEVEVLEFPRDGRGDQVRYTGVRTVSFHVPIEMQRHVKAWSEQPDAGKIRAAIYAITRGTGYPGVEYEFRREREISRCLQWPYTADEVAFQIHALKSAD